ncbi:MAG: alpha/beta fold hydrolase, partial [Planctomycetota bacterium]|jgi:pimeloyl-ACP methyl ester carboxylesterase
MTLTLDRPWGRMAYTRTDAPGPVYLYLSGTGCDSTDWAGIAEHLPGPVTSVALDFPGHGESEGPACDLTFDDLVDDAAALIDALGLEVVIGVGHSLGGMVAIDLAARCPAVAGLVLVEGWSCGAAWGAFAEGHLFGTLGPAELAALKVRDKPREARWQPERWSRFWETVRAYDGVATLASLTIPTVHLYGTFGRHAESLAALRLPTSANHTLVWLEGAGHYLPQERPAEVADCCWQMSTLAQG